VTPLVSLREALADPNLLGHALQGDSWQSWRALLFAALGEPLSDDERVIFKQLTGREREPGERVNELAVVAGRRAGKSRALATLAAYLTALHDYRAVLARGEKGVALIVAQNQRSARIVLDYCEALFADSPMLRSLVVGRSDTCLELRHDLVLEVRWASFRALRGPSYLAVLADELAYWWPEDGGYANPDVEVLNAARPGLLTTGGMLVLASSPYGRRGALFDVYRKHYGPTGAPLVLVAKGGTRAFNSTISQQDVERELERDPARATAEFLGEFRSDIETFVALHVVADAVGDYVELAPAALRRYHGFVDPSGGSGGDSFTLAISHRDDDSVVIDAVRERRPPFSPGDVITEFSRLLKSYRVSKVTSDRFAGGFLPEQFAGHGINFEPAVKTKSDLYVDLLPLLNSGGVVLPRNDRLVAQLVGLERRTARGTGRDIVDHSPGGHDDLANAVAGAALLARAPGYDTSLAWIDGSPIDNPSSHDTRRSMRSP
jgi:hypothetical protein